MTTTAAVLGTGIMGAGMARNMAWAGLDVTVWNRSPDKAIRLADVGARVADDPASAVAGADVVVTMLFDGAAVEEVMAQALPAAGPGTVWVQSSTVGPAAIARLADLAARHGLGFVDAPVLGTRRPAQDGTLVVLASGPEELRDPVKPVFDAVGSRTIWVGERPGDAHRLKLVANSYVLSVVAATAQAIGLSRDLGLDPQMFLDALAGGPLDGPYMRSKAAAMLAGEFPAEFPLDGAVKDAALIAQAMREAGTDDRLMAALHAQYAAAADGGHGAEDLAAVVRVVGARP